MLNCEPKGEQTIEQGPLSRRYTGPSVQAIITANSPTLQEYWDEDFSNVTLVQYGINSLCFNTLAANIDLHLLTSRNQPDRLENPVMDSTRWTKQEAEGSQEQVDVRGNITRWRSHDLY